MSRFLGKAALTIAALALGLWIARPQFLGWAQRKFLTTGPNGPMTPAAEGLAFARLKIPSGGRRLDGYLVEAPGDSRPRCAVLIFHGAGETISDWVQVQRYLHDRGVSSLVFDYSGHGDSSRPGTVRNLNEDGLAAYRFFLSRYPSTDRRCTLGHSMGNAVMLKTMAECGTQPSAVVMANAFSSLREEVAQWGSPVGARLMPDVWNNVRSAPRVHAPLLVIQSDADPGTPTWMGERIFAAASEPKRLVILRGFEHNALYRKPSDAWWNPVLAFLSGMDG